jgi:hypothetical protein
MNGNADKIKELAPQVAQEHEQYEAALADERRVHASLLAAIREMVRPALRALGSRVTAGGTRSPAGLTTDPAAFRGVHLAGTGLLPAVLLPDKRGEFTGYDLFLSVDGIFEELHYFGAWSGVKGEVTTWRSRSSQLTPKQVAAEYDVGHVLEQLRHRLKEQVQGEKPEHTRMIRARLDRVNQLIAAARKDLP